MLWGGTKCVLTLFLHESICRILLPGTHIHWGVEVLPSIGRLAQG